MATDEILDVTRVSKDGGDYCVKCPHCGDIIGIDGDDLSEIRGEQYQHKRREWQGPHGMKSVGCDGWFQVSDNARFVREVPHD
jgi:phage terminase large subunit GpA-like protein